MGGELLRETNAGRIASACGIILLPNAHPTDRHTQWVRPGVSARVLLPCSPDVRHENNALAQLLLNEMLPPTLASYVAATKFWSDGPSNPAS